MNKPEITINETVEMKVIYVRFRGTYAEFRKQSNRLFKTLFAFAEKYNLVIPDVSKVLTIYNDNPFITDAENLRTSVAMSVPLDTKIEENDEVSVMMITGKFGIGHFEMGLGEYDEAWKYMYNDWLFAGEQTPRDAFPFELYVTEPPKNFKSKSLTDIYIPII